MAIFDKKKLTGFTIPKKVMGAYMPLSLIEYVSLHGLCSQTTNSELVEKLINEWKAKEEETGQTHAELIEMTSQLAIENYKAQKKPGSIKTYLVAVEKELKGVTAETVELILKKVKDGA